jgi:hypothetical protein
LPPAETLRSDLTPPWYVSKRLSSEVRLERRLPPQKRELSQVHMASAVAVRMCSLGTLQRCMVTCAGRWKAQRSSNTARGSAARDCQHLLTMDGAQLSKDSIIHASSASHGGMISCATSTIRTLLLLIPPHDRCLLQSQYNHRCTQSVSRCTGCNPCL